jgi:hypothetical protein
MQILPYQTKYFKEMYVLWKKRKWKPPSKKILPKNGFVCLIDGKVVGYLGVYVEQEVIAVISWAILDIDLKLRVAVTVLDGMLHYAIETAKTNRCKAIYSFTDEPGWGELLQKHGMKISETNVTSFMMVL